MRELNDWNVSYSVIRFFCLALDGHDKVASYTRTKDIFFAVSLTNGQAINVLLVNDYVLGLATVLRAREEFPDAEYIVTGGNWNGYTEQAKDYGRKNAIGVFNIGEFLGSLNWTNPKKYCQKDENGRPVYSFKGA